jgi:hypothetical protein
VGRCDRHGTPPTQCRAAAGGRPHEWGANSSGSKSVTITRLRQCEHHHTWSGGCRVTLRSHLRQVTHPPSVVVPGGRAPSCASRHVGLHDGGSCLLRVSEAHLQAAADVVGSAQANSLGSNDTRTHAFSPGSSLSHLGSPSSKGSGRSGREGGGAGAGSAAASCSSKSFRARSLCLCSAVQCSAVQCNAGARQGLSLWVAATGGAAHTPLLVAAAAPAAPGDQVPAAEGIPNLSSTLLTCSCPSPTHSFIPPSTRCSSCCCSPFSSFTRAAPAAPEALSRSRSGSGWGRGAGSGCWVGRGQRPP